MDAAHDSRRQLGRLMVEEGLLTADQLAFALREQARLGRPLGKILVDLGFVSHGAVANALAEQHGGLLKTEFGISAGLHALPGGAESPQPDRATELEEQLHVVLTERNELLARAAQLEANLSMILDERNELAHRVNGLLERLAEVAKATPEPEPEEPPETAHVLFVPSPEGYSLVERDGPAPASGTRVDVDGLGFAVGRVGRSPVGDGLRCAFLLQL